MNDCIAFAKRNFLCFFRDRSAVMFSLMTVFIVILLYLLFLRDMLIIDGSEGMPELMDAWVLAGLLGIVSVTVSAGSLQTMIEDKTSSRYRDFMMTSMSSYRIAMGYILSTFAVGMTMSMITLIISVIYLSVTSCPVSVEGILMSVVFMVPSALSGSVIIYAVTSFLKSTAAYSGFFTIISVLIGFLAGIYMPMGTMPELMQIIGTLVPATHMAAIFRYYLSGDALDSVFSGADPAVLSEFEADMGYTLSLGGFEFSILTSLIYVLLVSAVFFLIAVYSVRKNRS